MVTVQEDDVWQHVKRGTFYVVKLVGVLREHDRCESVVYRALGDGQLWTRPIEEFLDGRYVRIGRI